MAGEDLFSVVFTGWGGGGFWFVNCLLAVLITAIIMGTVYAIAVAFNLMGLKRYATSEFLQLAATAVMVIFLVSIVENGQLFFTQAMEDRIVICGERDITDPLDAAMCRAEERLEYFNNMFYEIKDGDDLYYEELEYYSSLSMIGIIFWQGNWDPDTHKFVETAHAIEYKIVSLMISLNSQMFVLKYISENMLAFFLPLGIVLRTMHFTRGIGGFFIALAVSMYFIYPGVLFMMDSYYAPSAEPPPSPVMNRESLCNMPVFSGISLGTATVSGQGARSATALSISSGDLAAFISQVFVRLFYDNMVAFAIAITAMRYMSMLLGGESGLFLQMMARWV